MTDKLHITWNAVHNDGTWMLIPSLIVSKDYRSLTVAIAFLPWCVGADISW